MNLEEDITGNAKGNECGKETVVVDRRVVAKE